MNLSRPTHPQKVHGVARTGQKAKKDSFLRPPYLWEEVGLVGTGQKAQRHNLLRPSLPHKQDASTTIHTDGSLVASLTGETWLSGWLSSSPDEGLPSKVGSFGLTDWPIEKQKVLKDGLPRPWYQDTRTLLSRPCRSRSMVPVGGTLKKIVQKWVGITQDPFWLGTVQEHLLQFNWKAPLAKPTHKGKARTQKTHEDAGALQIG